MVIAPALGVRASYYGLLCAQLAEGGIDAVAVDLPGTGTSPIRASRRHDWGYDEVIEHYRSACEAVRRRRPGVPLIVIGHSIGGQIALMLGGCAIEGLVGTVVVASGCPWWRCWDGLDAPRILASTTAAMGLAKVLGYFPGDRVGFGGREARTLIRQWANASQTGRYESDDFDGEALLQRPGPPALAICIEGDNLAPAASMRLPLGRMTQRSITFEHWADAPYGGDHNRWPTQPDFVAQRVSKMLDDVVSS